MRTLIAIFFIACVLSASVNAGSTELCNKVLEFLKEKVSIFYFSGKIMIDNNFMTPEYQAQYDDSAYEVAQAIEAGCGGLGDSEVTQIAQAMFETPSVCNQNAGEFTISMIKGVESGESKEGVWDSLFMFATMCEAPQE